MIVCMWMKLLVLLMVIGLGYMMSVDIKLVIYCCIEC